jgi:hypothetical protein
LPDIDDRLFDRRLLQHIRGQSRHAAEVGRLRLFAHSDAPLRMSERRFRRKAEMALSSLPCAPFPPPWTIEEHNSACFIVRDKNGQALGYFYFEEEPGRRSVGNGAGAAALNLLLSGALFSS